MLERVAIGKGGIFEKIEVKIQDIEKGNSPKEIIYYLQKNKKK